MGKVLIVIVLVLAIVPFSAQAGIVTRSFSTNFMAPGESLTVYLSVDVTEGIDASYAIDDGYDVAWTVTDSGPFNASEAGHAKIINYTSITDTVFAYTMDAPSTLRNYSWSGLYQFNGTSSESTILGEVTVTVGFCSNGAERDCGPQNYTGQCVRGLSTCSGGEWGSCIGATYPSDETCDGDDQDCDGVLDGSEGLIQQCGTTDVGICEYGSQSCDDLGAWSTCSGGIGPGTEICPNNDVDDDCDGNDNEYRGDVECNAVVDILDLSFVASHFGETPADGSWNVSADIVANNEIDVFDLVTVGSSFGNTYD